MARKLKQDNRICELTTPLGKDELVFTGLEATEGLSELFEFHIECLSENDHINFDAAIGQQREEPAEAEPSASLPRRIL